MNDFKFSSFYKIKIYILYIYIYIIYIIYIYITNLLMSIKILATMNLVPMIFFRSFIYRHSIIS